MKTVSKLLALVLFVALAATGCRPDNVKPKDSPNNDSPVLQADGAVHPVLSPICSDKITYRFAKDNGSFTVDYGFPPPTGFPDWGTAVVYNGIDEYGVPTLAIDFTMAFGWFLDLTKSKVGVGNDFTLDNNTLMPIGTENWRNVDVNPAVNAWQLRWDITDVPQPCFDLAIQVVAVKLDFFSGVDVNSTTNLWAWNSDWDNASTPEKNTDSPMLMKVCPAPCPTDEVCTPEFLTYNQCAYGVCGTDGPAAQLRDQLFATAFPDGLVLGCATGNTLTLNSSSAVEAFLPSKGGKVLTNNMVDPIGKFRNPNEKICPGFAPATCGTIDFDTDGIKEEGDGMPLAKGTFITDQYLDDIGMTITGESNHHNRTGSVIIFDSSNPTGGDYDLGTPNQAYGGPGIGNAGTSSQGRNDVAENNIIILAENVRDNNNDGRVDGPDDDAAGGTISFNFNTPITIEAVTLVDLDDHANNVITLKFDDGRPDVVISCPQIGNNSRKIVMTKEADGSSCDGVTSMSVSFSGSGGIAGICFCKPGNLDSGCINPSNQGFASTIAGRLAAAKLNVAFDEADPNMGVSTSKFGDLIVRAGIFANLTVNDVIAEADNFIGGCGSTFAKNKLNGALKKINDSFRDATRQNNFLICPQVP